MQYPIEPSKWAEMNSQEREEYLDNYVNEKMDDYEDREVMEGLD